MTRLTALFVSQLLSIALLASTAGPALADDPQGRAPGPEQATTIYLVRHAEKDRSVEEDPPLTEAGRARAEHLAHVLADAGIDAVYTTQWQRTRQTAAPLAKALGLEPRVAETTQGHVRSLAQTLLESHPGQQVLVVGHSNTVPGLARRLGAADAPDIPDHQNHDLYVVRLQPDGEGGQHIELTHLRYGRPSVEP